MFYFYDDFFMMMAFLAIALVAIALMRRAMAKSKESSTGTTAESSPKNQIAEDIKATKTSRIEDAVSILDDLGTSSSTYRHYCELIGRSMASSSVIAPYSKREVAYYDIKCYRIDAKYGGGQEETLIAHEHSFDPFFFTDGSCDTPVYIDLESFGDNVILVNSTNHIEGPNSDFAKAVGKSAGAATTGAGTTYNMVAQSLARAKNALLGAADALREALRPRRVPQLAYALAGSGSISAQEAGRVAANVKFAGQEGRGDGRSGGSGSHGGGHDGRGVTSGRGGGRPQGGDRDDRRPQVTIHMGYGSQMPGHLGDFMGPSHQPYVMGGGYTIRPTSRPSSTDILLGMSLASLLNSMNTTQQTITTQNAVDTFRGYRLVENVVPLGSPIYCIGEIYRHGTDVYMSRSLAKDYPTSFFATKPESEVLSAIGGV